MVVSDAAKTFLVSDSISLCCERGLKHNTQASENQQEDVRTADFRGTVVGRCIWIKDFLGKDMADRMY